MKRSTIDNLARLKKYAENDSDRALSLFSPGGLATAGGLGALDYWKVHRAPGVVGSDPNAVRAMSSAGMDHLRDELFPRWTEGKKPPSKRRVLRKAREVGSPAVRTPGWAEPMRGKENLRTALSRTGIRGGAQILQHELAYKLKDLLSRARRSRAPAAGTPGGDISDILRNPKSRGLMQTPGTTLTRTDPPLTKNQVTPTGSTRPTVYVKGRYRPFNDIEVINRMKADPGFVKEVFRRFGARARIGSKYSPGQARVSRTKGGKAGAALMLGLLASQAMGRQGAGQGQPTGFVTD